MSGYICIYMHVHTFMQECILHTHIRVRVAGLASNTLVHSSAPHIAAQQ